MSGLSRNKVVVPVDFSDQSFAAVDVALEIAKQPADVCLVHVLPELIATEPGVVWNMVDDATRKTHVLDALKEKLADAPYDGVEMRVEIGDPGRKITEVAEELSADLVVVPSHGRTGLTRLLLGSVAERVVRLAHCPVLVLRD